jgi:hypothetical protein
VDYDWRKVLVAVASILIGVWLLYHHHEYIAIVLLLGPIIIAAVFPKLFDERNPYR